MIHLYFEIGFLLMVVLCGLGLFPPFIRQFGKVTWGDLASTLFLWPLMLVIVYTTVTHKQEDDDTLY
jgi:hypothetical protein